MNILEYLRQNNEQISAVCGGNGTCGRCLVSIDGSEPVLACRSEYRPGMDIRVIDRAERMSVLGTGGETDSDTSHITGGRADEGNTSGSVNDHDSRYGIAIDIGTTTIAGALCHMRGGSYRVISEESRINPNVSFGADVISRIKAGAEGCGKMMRDGLLGAVREVIFGLCSADGTGKRIDRIALAGNTAMIHILMGYDTGSLGVFPYTPVNIQTICGRASEILEIKSNDIINIEDSHCVIFPGISAYVGGDIVSGLYYLEGIKTPDISMFIDLGTNGEMALITRDIVYAASTSAGPVFEGGSISCGCGSVAGAIDHIKIHDGKKVSYTTIADGKLIAGICGSGVIDCAAEIYRNGLCTERGTFMSDSPLRVARYPDMSSVSFTQDDMRQVQLAKAAIAAGAEILCRSAGISYEDIGTLYLAGGMGHSVDTGSAAAIGLIPRELEKRAISVGNSSLKGALRLVTGDEAGALERIASIAEDSRLEDLAGAPGFQDTYIRHMDLPE